MNKDLKKNKKRFEYAPQLLLLAVALSVIFFAAYLSFRQNNEMVIAPASLDATPSLPGATILAYQEKDMALADLLVSDKNLIIFWATWCGPCVDEIKRMPKLLSLIKQKGYTPLFINYDPFENKKVAQSFAEKNGVLTAFDFRGEILGNLGISSLPVSLLVDKTGKVMKIIYGELDINKL